MLRRRKAERRGSSALSIMPRGGEQPPSSITSKSSTPWALIRSITGHPASDGQAAMTYRRPHLQADELGPGYLWTGRRSGQQTGSFAEKYTVTDVEGDNVVVTEFYRRQADPQLPSRRPARGDDRALPREYGFTSHGMGRNQPPCAEAAWTAISSDEREGLNFQEGDGHRLPSSLLEEISGRGRSHYSYMAL